MVLYLRGDKMKNRLVIRKCPICSSNLVVTELSCPECNTKISGRFSLSKFDSLTDAQLNFALTFIKNAGNIKLIEKELNISYPTVKKNIDDLIKALGFEKVNVTQSIKPTKDEVLSMLKNKEISFEEADEFLKEKGI